MTRSSEDDNSMNLSLASPQVLKGVQRLKTMAEVRQKDMGQISDDLTDEEEEISVTDSEGEGLEMHRNGCYDDSGCHEDEEDFGK